VIERTQIDRFRSQLQQLETELSSPATAADQAKFQRLMTRHKYLRNLIATATKHFALQDTLSDLKSMLDNPANEEEILEMAREEIAATRQQLAASERELMMALLPPDPSDDRNTIVEIRAGTGGEEAALFAADLFRMYSRFAEERGWTSRIIDISEASAGGYKEIVFSVEGANVYRDLRYESGVHRVQRVPVTETQGRIHTSAASVAVLPEADVVDEIEIKPDEIRIDLFCASGPGGQSVNKTTSAVRITHLATGIVAQSQDERSQHRNKDRAMSVLKARLLDKMQREAAAAEASTRKSQIGSGDRSERIRTYNFPQNRVTDHRANCTLHSLDRFIEGDLDEMISKLREMDMEERLASQMDKLLQ
jgi:peptide chain release factor 1